VTASSDLSSPLKSSLTHAVSADCAVSVAMGERGELDGSVLSLAPHTDTFPLSLWNQKD